MKFKGLFAVSALALSLSLSPAQAETRVETVLGTVTYVETLTSNIIRKTPTDERVCRTEDVPVYEQASGNESNLGGLIVGGLIGSAIGNKLSDANGGGAAGAVAGALLGAEASKKNAQKGEIVGYRRQEICEVQRVVLEETIERIDGYKIEVELDNRIVSLRTKRAYEKGQRVEISKKITYSLN